MPDDISTSRPSIRAAGRGDADALLTLVVDVLDADDPDPVHGPWTRHLLDLPGAPAVGGGSGGVVVAERDGALLGCAWLLPQPLVVHGRPVDAVQLEQVAVVADQRGKGLARRLIQAALQQARAGGADVVLVRGDPQLYTRLGFRPAIERPAATRIRSDRLAALAVEAIPTRPATPADAALLARWDAAAKGWLLRRTRTVEEWRVEVTRPTDHPWRTAVHLVLSSKGEPLGAGGVLQLPGAPPVLHRLITAHGADQGVVLAGAAAAADRDGVVRLALPSEHGAWATLPEITPAPAGRWLVAPSRRAPVGPSGDPAGSADGVGSKSEEVATQLRDLSPGHCDLWPLA